MVISGIISANCNLKNVNLTEIVAEVSTRGPPERVKAPYVVTVFTGWVFKESCTLILVHKAGDKLLLRLNICRKPIANKYCEGKMKSTLERELKDLKSLRRKR
jgi:hypothetical protein